MRPMHRLAAAILAVTALPSPARAQSTGACVLRPVGSGQSWSAQDFGDMLEVNCRHQCNIMVWEFDGAMECSWRGASIMNMWGTAPAPSNPPRRYCSVRDNALPSVAWRASRLGSRTRAECDAACATEARTRGEGVLCIWGTTGSTISAPGPTTPPVPLPPPGPTPPLVPLPPPGSTPPVVPSQGSTPLPSNPSATAECVLRPTGSGQTWSTLSFPAMLRANCEDQCSIMVWELSGPMSCEWGGAVIRSNHGAGPPQPVGGTPRHYCSARNNVGGEVAWNATSFGTQTRAECDASCRGETDSRQRPVVCRWGQTSTAFGVLGRPPGGVQPPPPQPPPPQPPPPQTQPTVQPSTPPAAATAVCTLQTQGGQAPPSQYLGNDMIQGNCLLQCEIISQVFGGRTTCVWGSTPISTRVANPPTHGAFCSARENVSAAQPWNLVRLGEQPIWSDCRAACSAIANQRRQSVLCTYGATAFTLSGP